MTATMTLPPNIEAVFASNGGLTLRYCTCPYCAGEMHRYMRAAHPHGYRSFGRCVECGAAWWEHEEHARIMDSLADADRVVAA